MGTLQTSTLAGTGVLGYNDGVQGVCQIGAPYGLTVQQSTGNVFVADYTGMRIRMITPTGFCTTLAGPTGAAASGALDGIGTNARFNSPKGMAFDLAGNLYVADQVNSRSQARAPTFLFSRFLIIRNSPPQTRHLPPRLAFSQTRSA